MNSFELNKIFGAILGTLVFVMGVGFIADAIYAPIEHRGSGYELPMPEGEEGGGQAEVAQIEPIAVRMQNASPEAGEGLINRCQSCHDYSPANENRTGPGIYDIVGHEIAAHPGFAYSDALLELAEGGEVWDYEHLDGFLESPRGYTPGTKMTFAGLSDPQDRADLIAFLRTLSEDPYPLPEAPAAEEGAEDEAAAAEGEDAAAEEGDAEAGADGEEPVVQEQTGQEPSAPVPGAGGEIDDPSEEVTPAGEFDAAPDGEVAPAAEEGTDETTAD